MHARRERPRGGGGMEVSERERRAALRFWERLNACEDQINAAVEEVAKRIPSIAAVMAATTPEMREKQRAEGREMQRRVLVEGRWDEYLTTLRTQGQVYAQMGIGFRDWFALLGSYRSAVMRDLLPP